MSNIRHCVGKIIYEYMDVNLTGKFLGIKYPKRMEQ